MLSKNHKDMDSFAPCATNKFTQKKSDKTTFCSKYIPGFKNYPNGKAKKFISFRKILSRYRSNTRKIFNGLGK